MDMKRKRKARALVLFSGGLDSILTVKILRKQGISVEAVHFTCPFYSSEWARKGAKSLRLRIHKVPVDRAYFRIVARPRFGYGSQVNPCIDCKVYMLRRAERLRKKLGFDFLATGEVVGERPMSQTRGSLIKIEKEAGLSGRVVRPLSGRILAETHAEKKGLLNRKGLESISGRSRKRQMGLAKAFGIKAYPAPAGGCLLTDPEYAKKVRGHLDTRGRIDWDSGELLKFGRHFWKGMAKIVVGRNEGDNKEILRVARRMGLTVLEVVGIPGPTTVIEGGRPSGDVIDEAACLTARYSDAPKGVNVKVRIKKGNAERFLEVVA
jgi:hypothetical protein